MQGKHRQSRSPHLGSQLGKAHTPQPPGDPGRPRRMSHWLAVGAKPNEQGGDALCIFSRAELLCMNAIMFSNRITRGFVVLKSHASALQDPRAQSCNLGIKAEKCPSKSNLANYCNAAWQSQTSPSPHRLPPRQPSWSSHPSSHPSS